MSDATGTTSYTYDMRDRLTRKVTAAGNLNYSYDKNGNVKSVVSGNANGTNVLYSYDAANRLINVGEQSGGGSGSYTYDQVGQPKVITYGNGVRHDITYNQRDWETGVTITGPTGILASYASQFSLNGHRTRIDEISGRSTAFTYDSSLRLTSEAVSGDTASANNGILSYTLDRVGNRISLTSTIAALAAQTKTSCLVGGICG